MRITFERTRKLSQAEIAQIAGLPANASKEQVNRVYLDQVADFVGLPEGSDTATLRREVQAFGSNFAQQAVEQISESNELIGRLLQRNLQPSRRARTTMDFVYREEPGKEFKVTVDLSDKPRRGRVARGTMKTTRVLRK